MKRIFNLLIAATLACSQLGANAATPAYNPNNLRTMFQNNDAVIYALNIRTFNANDKNRDEIIDLDAGEESGTFLNAINRLDELQTLGINTVHLLPITPVGKIKATGTAGSLYAMSDFATLNPQLADQKSKLPLEQQAKLFVDECHKRNIKVIVDLPSCGSYDLYIKQPDLFILDRKQQPVVPADWTDVRIFKTVNSDGTINQDLLDLHKKFVDLVVSIGADGIRADVAPMKPYEFWVKLIKYARAKDPEFLFLAEASDSWTTPVSEYATYTDYKKLLQAGFDGYYGSYFNYKTWKCAGELKKQVTLNQAISKSYPDKKSTIGSFATHDEVSPIIIGNEGLSEQIMWLDATLPLNPYYVDGFISGDTYMYGYSNKKANKSYTDDDYYYVHKGKLDIFNFSREPGGKSQNLVEKYYLTLKLRGYAHDVITKGNFKLLSTNNSKIWAYSRSYGGKTLIVILNKDKDEKQSSKIHIAGINTKQTILPVRFTNTPKVKNGEIKVDLDPADSIILFIEDFKN